MRHTLPQASANKNVYVDNNPVRHSIYGSKNATIKIAWNELSNWPSRRSRLTAFDCGHSGRPHRASDCRPLQPVKIVVGILYTSPARMAAVGMVRSTAIGPRPACGMRTAARTPIGRYHLSSATMRSHRNCENTRSLRPGSAAFLHSVVVCRQGGWCRKTLHLCLSVCLRFQSLLPKEESVSGRARYG